MSTSSTSGIQVSAELKSTFESAKRLNNLAFIKVQIVNDTLESVATEKKGGQGWSGDYDQIQRVLDADVPCFIIFFKGRDDLILALYVPEDASVKNKMSYSSSKSALNTMLNARQFASSGTSSGSSKQVEQIFGTTKAEFTHRAYSSNKNIQGPKSEVEEALEALPKTIDRKEFGKSMGYSLLATVSGKALPPQLKNYAGQGAGNAPQTSTSLFRGGQFNIFNKPSEAKQANKPSGINVNRPPPGQGVLPGFGAVAAKASPISDANSSSSSSSSNGTSNGRRLSVSTGKCLVSTCENKRVKNGYCKSCLDASEDRRQKIFGGTD